MAMYSSLKTGDDGSSPSEPTTPFLEEINFFEYQNGYALQIYFVDGRKNIMSFYEDGEIRSLSALEKLRLIVETTKNAYSPGVALSASSLDEMEQKIDNYGLSCAPIAFRAIVAKVLI
jgi:hypothetical protein